MCRSTAMRVASARSTIAHFRWPRARWTGPNSPPFSARLSSTWPPPASTARCTTSASIGVISKSFWRPGERAIANCWVKDNGRMGSLYRSQHELVFVFKHGRSGHRNNVQLGHFGRNRSNVWRYPGANSFARNSEEGNLLALHPTVKPVAMIADAIMDCSARGDIILDPFLGSGTTLIASERTGRTCYGLELDPVYVDT